MVLPRTEQAIPQNRPPLGVIREYVDGLVQACMGRSYSLTAWLLCKGIHASDHIVKKCYEIPESIEEIREALASAWFLEEEDLYQQCWIAIFTRQESVKTWHGMKVTLLRCMREYLVKKIKVFRRQREQPLPITDERAYEWDPDLDSQWLSIGNLLKSKPCTEMSPFFHYISYCLGLGYTQTETHEALDHFDHRQFVREVARLRPLLEKRRELYATHNAG